MPSDISPSELRYAAERRREREIENCNANIAGVEALLERAIRDVRHEISVCDRDVSVYTEEPNSLAVGEVKLGLTIGDDDTPGSWVDALYAVAKRAKEIVDG